VVLHLGDCHAVDLAFGDDDAAAPFTPQVLPEELEDALRFADEVELFVAVA
jgi:hypothetical protein